jgi:hypothetical protein
MGEGETAPRPVNFPLLAKTLGCSLEQLQNEIWKSSRERLGSPAESQSDSEPRPERRLLEETERIRSLAREVDDLAASRTSCGSTGRCSPASSSLEAVSEHLGNLVAFPWRLRRSCRVRVRPPGSCPQISGCFCDSPMEQGFPSPGKLAAYATGSIRLTSIRKRRSILTA